MLKVHVFAKVMDSVIYTYTLYIVLIINLSQMMYLLFEHK